MTIDAGKAQSLITRISTCDRMPDCTRVVLLTDLARALANQDLGLFTRVSWTFHSEWDSSPFGIEEKAARWAREERVAKTNLERAVEVAKRLGVKATVTLA